MAHDRNVGPDVHWGDDGCCIDPALHHPARAEDVTNGVRRDTNRHAVAKFALAPVREIPSVGRFRRAGAAHRPEGDALAALSGRAETGNRT
jgi:hypothetical protein